MSVRPADYEEVLATYSDRAAAIGLLKQHRPYLEMLPSLRRPLESAITIALPLVRADADSLEVASLADLGDRRLRLQREARHADYGVAATRLAVRLPCEVALLMCDPEWQVTTGIAIFLFIHRPGEDFYHLLSRWRQVQLLLDREYEWMLPADAHQVSSDSAEQIYPLFLVLAETPSRILRGLTGAHLPYALVGPASLGGETAEDLSEPESLPASFGALVAELPTELPTELPIVESVAERSPGPEDSHDSPR